MAGLGMSSNTAFMSQWDRLGNDERFKVLYGDLTTLDTTEPQDRVPNDNRTLPFASRWRRQARTIENVLSFMISEEDMFISRDVLPLTELRAGEIVNVQTLKFEPFSMDQMPQEGVAQNVSNTMSSSSYQGRTYGGAFQIQDSMLKTPAGFLIYSGSIMQIETACKNQICVAAYNAILSANQINQANGNVTPYEILSVNQNQGIVGLIDEEVYYWSCLTKTPHGFRELRRRGENVFSKRQIKPDFMFVPNNTGTFLEGSRPELNDYARRGPNSPDNDLSYSGYLGHLRNVSLYETPLYKIDDRREPADPTERERTIGEFFDSKCSRFSELSSPQYKTSLRSVSFMNEVSKMLEKKTLLEMIRYSGLFAKEEMEHEGPDAFPVTVETPFHKAIFGEIQTIATYVATLGDTKLQHDLQPHGSQFLRWSTFKSLMDADLPVPVDFRIARPFMRYPTTSGAMMKKGAGTGNSFYGDANFVLTFDGTRRILNGTHTCVIGAKVYDPNKVFVFPNIFVGPIISGGGCEFFDPLNEDHRRLFQQGDHGERSLFSIPMRPGEKFASQPYFDLTGYFPDFSSAVDGPMNTAQYLAHSAFLEAWQLSNHPETYLKINYFAGNTGVHTNTLCCQGAYVVPRHVPGAGGDGYIKERGELIQGRGHWGPSIYNGVCDHRAGKNGNGVAPVQEKLQELLSTS